MGLCVSTASRCCTLTYTMDYELIVPAPLQVLTWALELLQVPTEGREASY